MSNSEYKITVVLTEDLYKLISESAGEVGVSKSTLLRMILTKHFKEQGAK